MVTRRQFLKVGLAGSLLVSCTALVLAPSRDSVPQGMASLSWLTPADVVVVAAIAPVMLGVPDVPREVVVAGVDRAISALPAAVQQEVRQLFDILGNPWGRRWLAGVRENWSTAPAGVISAFLERWRVNRFMLFRSAYQALHALIAAAWYGNTASWASIGYRQPASFKEYLG